MKYFEKNFHTHCLLFRKFHNDDDDDDDDVDAVMLWI